MTKSQVGLGNVTNDSQVKRSEMGTANGVATLDANGIINTSQLPSYVDDVLEYTAKSSFPTTGETGKIYVDTSTNLTWRWSGTQYVEISPSLALGETSSTAYRGDRGKTAYDHTSLTNNPHGVTKSQVGLGSVVNTGDSATPVSGGTTKFTTGGAYTELNKKADKSSAVTDVAWDTTNKKITKTINGTTSDVVTPGTMLDSFDDSYENLAGTGIFIAANPQTAWKKYPISKLWSWIQQSIGSILGLYIDNTTQQKRFSGTSSYAVTATNANNANLSHSYNPNTDSGESVLQIGTGTAQSCVRSANTYKVYGWGTAAAGYANTYWELGSDTTRPTLTISYSGTGNAYRMRLTESSLKFSLGSDTATVYLEAYDGLVYQYSGSNAETNYSGSNWTINNPGSQFKITADRDAEKIEISKSTDATTIKPTNIVSPAVDLYVGGTNNLRLVGSSDGTRVRVCSATNTASLKDLQAQKFYGPLQGNVTGNVTGDCSGSSGSCTGNAATATVASGVVDGCITSSKLDVGIVRKSGDYFVPRLPFLWVSADVNLSTATDALTAAVRANGYGTPITVYNHSNSEITVSGLYPNKTGSEKIPTKKTRTFTFYRAADGFFAAY